MTLADLTRERLCVSTLRGREPTTVLMELSLAFADTGLVSDALSLFNAALNDHFLTTHDVLGSIAFPVVRSHCVDSPVFAMGRSREPIRWREGLPSIRLVFLIAAPQLQSRRLGRLLASISDVARDERALAALLNADRSEDLLETLRTLALPGGEPLTPGLLV